MKYPPCGRLCHEETCEGFKKKLCPGCVESNGSPPGCIDYLPKKFNGVKVCPIWECAKKHKMEHCGECDKFPCKLFLSWYDPKHGKKSVIPYIGLLLIRKKLGEEEWIKCVKIHKKK